MRTIRTISRILVGIVFTFSGFVKGVDPLGTAYRIEDYFNAFHMPWAVPFALFLSVFLCTLEFAVGISMLFNFWIKKSAWLLLFMMIYFTILTFFDATVNLVPECGCFGDAIKLTNLQTFLNNLVLLVFVFPVFSGRKKFRGVIPDYAQFIGLLLFSAAFIGMSVYSLRHLPIIDFMDWRVGNKVNEKSSKPLEFYLIFKNKETGKEQEFLSPNYPWNDSVWMSEWEFKKQKVVDPNGSQAVPLRITDERGIDVTSNYLDNPDFQFILVSYDITKTNKDAFRKILPLYHKAVDNGYSFICITTLNGQEIKNFKLSEGIIFDFYNGVDDIVMKTMVRSNPGLILLKGGKVLGKWHYNDFPSYEEVMMKYK